MKKTFLNYTLLIVAFTLGAKVLFDGNFMGLFLIGTSLISTLILRRVKHDNSKNEVQS